MLAPPLKPSSFRLPPSQAPRKEPATTPGSRPKSKPAGAAPVLSTRISHSAEGPLKVRPCTGTMEKELADTLAVNHQPAATINPVPRPPTHFQKPQPLRSAYQKLTVRVVSLEGEFSAWVYVFDGYEGGMPTAWYLSEIANAAEKAGAPDDYVSELRQRPTRTSSPEV